jgi:SAM-dependent methyltransferase
VGSFGGRPDRGGLPPVPDAGDLLDLRGTVRFVGLRESTGSEFEYRWAAQTITASRGLATRSFTFPANLRSRQTAEALGRARRGGAAAARREDVATFALALESQRVADGAPANPMSAEFERHAGLAPSAWIVRHAHLVREGGRVLDVAAGFGRHARFFAERGNRVVAVDRDQAALATFAGAPRVEFRVADLEGGAWPFAGETFDAIVVVHYLHRPLFPALLSALAPDGVLFYETFAAGNETYGRPANPAYLLRPGELLDVVRGWMTVVAFEQGLIAGPERPAVVARVVAVGPGRAWPPTLVPAA